MTNESGQVATDTGTVSSNGTIHIVEDGTVDLQGVLVGPGHIKGTWGPNGSSGPWDVTLVPTVAGTYSGTWTNFGSTATYPMTIQISQVGGVLSGSTNEGPVFTDQGTITAGGSLHIVETDLSNVVDLYATVVSSHELKGTWGASGSSGTWDVTK
jgi:hypothetical protein